MSGYGDTGDQRHRVAWDGDVALYATPASGGSGAQYQVEVGGRTVGGVRVVVRDGVGFASWDDPVNDVLTVVLGMLSEEAFGRLRLNRLEARVDASDGRSVRAAGRAGLRHEGFVRGVPAQRPGDTDERRTAQVARLRHDPPPDSHEGFIGALNAFLPRKRVIAHALIRDDAGRMLLCQQTYKGDWDLPGGVVEPAESPRVAVQREVLEELGADLEAGGLVAVNHLPPWFAWDDALTFLYDFGRHPVDLVETLRLQPSEIAAVHWCDKELVETRASRATAHLLLRVWDHDGAPVYLEAGADPV